MILIVVDFLCQDFRLDFSLRNQKRLFLIQCLKTYDKESFHLRTFYKVQLFFSCLPKQDHHRLCRVDSNNRALIRFQTDVVRPHVILFGSEILLTSLAPSSYREYGGR